MAFKELPLWHTGTRCQPRVIKDRGHSANYPPAIPLPAIFPSRPPQALCAWQDGIICPYARRGKRHNAWLNTLTEDSTDIRSLVNVRHQNGQRMRWIISVKRRGIIGNKWTGQGRCNSVCLLSLCLWDWAHTHTHTLSSSCSVSERGMDCCLPQGK